MSGEWHPPDRNLALELMRVTEAGALGAARAIGRGDPDLADRFAVDAVRRTLAVLPIDGVVVVGEGEGRGRERMYLGERLGSAEEPRMDIAVDPIDANARAFYLRWGFQPVEGDPHGRLFIRTRDALASFPLDYGDTSGLD